MMAGKLWNFKYKDAWSFPLHDGSEVFFGRAAEGGGLHLVVYGSRGGVKFEALLNAPEMCAAMARLYPELIQKVGKGEQGGE